MAGVRTRLLDSSAPRTDELVRICSWCKRFSTSDQEYVEIETAVVQQRFLDRDEMPSVTHTLCPDCEQRFGDGAGAAG